MCSRTTFGGWKAIGDRDFDERLRAELDAAVRTLSGEGTVVALVTLAADVATFGTQRPWGLDEETYRLRADRFNEILRAYAADHIALARVIDFDGWVRDNGGAVRLRPDGLTVDASVAQALSSWFLDQIVNLHASWWRSDGPGAHALVASEARTTRVLVVGDSTAIAIAVGLHGYGSASGRLEVASVARSNCGLGRGGLRRERAVAGANDCPDWQPVFESAVARFDPDVVVVVDAMWDLIDRQLPGDPVWRTVGDPLYDHYLRRELGTAFDVLQARGAALAVVRYPHIELGRNDTPRPATPYPASDPQRMDRMNDLLGDVVASRERASMIDLARFAAGFPDGELDASMRPDGVHFTEAASYEIAERFLAERIHAVAAHRPT